MKKRLFALSIFILTVLLILSGCSCQKSQKPGIDIKFDYSYVFDESHTDEEMRSHMRVFYTDSQGSVLEVHDYTMTRTSKNGGTSITVTYNGYEDTYILSSENKYVSIYAKRANGNAIFYDFTEDDIKNTIDVFGVTADGKEEEIYRSHYTVVKDKEYYTGGKHTLTITYKNLSCEIEISVYAQQLSISFDTNSQNVVIDKMLIDVATPVPELPTPTRAGYIFHGWKLNGEYFTEGTIINESIKLVADWEPIVGHIYFYIDGELVHEQEYICEKIEVIVPEIPEKTGHDAAWEDYVLDGRDISVSAIYTPKTYTLTFDYKGATSGNSITEMTVTYGMPIGRLPAPDKEGHSLSSWNITTHYFMGITAETVWTFTEDKTAWAEWIKDVNYIWRAPDLTYELNDDGQSYTVTGYGEETAAMTRFRVPAEYNSLPVTTIGDGAFEDHTTAFYVVVDEGIKHIDRRAFVGMSALKGIQLPETLESIGDYAFQRTALVELNIPNSLKKIGDYTFRGLTSLSRVTVDAIASLESIGMGAFSLCSSLSKITIPTSVTSIGEEAFGGCTSLTKVYIYDLSAWCNIDFESASANPLYYGDPYYDGEVITELVIPKDVTRIAPYTFYDCNTLTSITFEDGSLAEVISDYAFFNCRSLKYMTFDGDASLVTIGDMAFHNVDFTNIEIPASLTMIYGSAFNCTPSRITINDLAAWCQIKFAESMFDSDTTLSIANSSSIDIVIPSSVTKISSYAFYNYSYIKSLSFEAESSLTKIGDYAFAYSGITTVELPETLEAIGSHAFAHCSYLESIDLTETNITSLGNYAFYNSYLSSFTLPKGITSLGEHVFGKCTNLTSFYFEAGISITEIPYGSFSGCSALEAIILPECVTSIDYIAFFGCSNLESINLDNIDYINDSFGGCEKLCTLENYVYYVGKWAVAYDKEHCVDIVIKDGTERVASMFWGDLNLRSVTLPASITKLSANMFGGCSSLNHLTLPFIGEIAPSADSETFMPLGFLFGPYAHDGVKCVQSYYDTETGEIKEMEYVIPATLREVRVLSGIIPYNAFKGMNSITTVYIGPDVLGIDDYAFYKCNSLSSLQFEITEDGENSVSFIGDYAFYECIGLTGDLYIPRYVLTVGNYAFAECYNINTITCYEALKSIGTAAFSNCFRMRSFTFMSDTNCEYIGDSAFAFCEKLESFRFPINATIGEHVFAFCYSIKEFTALTDGTDFRIVDGVVYDSQRKVLRYYPSGSEATSFTIPTGVVKIEVFAFYGASKLTSVTIPTTLEEIGEDAFRKCTALKTINFTATSSLKKIGDYAFADTAITKITLPDSLEFMGQSVFDIPGASVYFEDSDSNWIVWLTDPDDYIDLSGKLACFYYSDYYNYHWVRV